ncbi:MAG: cupin domain-containing protein [Planctomycetota bacterium]
MAKESKAALPAELAARAAHVGDLAKYQAGGIVSRQIIQKKTGSVTLFAFDEGQALSEHTAPFDAFVQVLDGQVEITIAGKPLTVQAGEAVIMPAGQPHALRALTQMKMLLTMIRA